MAIELTDLMVKKSQEAKEKEPEKRVEPELKVEPEKKEPESKVEPEERVEPEVKVEPEKVVPEITDDIIFSSLQEKAGISAKSWDDLKTLMQREPDFADETLRVANEWVKKTNRSINEFLQMQELDITKLSEQEKALFQLKQENPHYTASDLQLLYNRKFRKQEIPEDASPEEVQRINEDNRFVELEVQSLAIKGEQAIKQMKEQFNVPVTNGRSEVNREQFAREWKNLSSQINGFDYQLTKDKSFTWKIEEADKQQFFNNPILPEDWMAQEYKMEDGSFNLSKFAQDVYFLKNREDVIRAAAASRSGEGVEDIIDEAKGLKSQDLNKEQSSGGTKSGKESARAIFLGQR